MIKLSLMIPTLKGRESTLDRLLFNLKWQCSKLHDPGEVEIIVNRDSGERTTGRKRNECVEGAKGVAMAFVDDDDMICDGYVQRGLEFANSDKDVASLIGLYFSNGVYDRPFIHSLKYNHWYQDEKFYYRNPNHLNFIKRDKVKDIKYRDITVGEDGHYSIALHEAKVIKKEFDIKQTLYLYYCVSK